MSKETITIIFRATDSVFGVHAKQRYFSKNKTEICKICFLSLYNSCLKFNDRFNFIVIGDRISDDLLNFFKEYKIPVIQKEFGGKTGLRDSIRSVLDIAYQCNSDWVWIQEDDYLFVEDTAESMLNIIDSKVVEQLNYKNLILFPIDYDIYYKSAKIKEQNQIVSLNTRYWRSISNTTFSWCVKTNFLHKNKKIFDQMFLDIKYKKFDWYISKYVWSADENLVLSPLPSLSAHLDENVNLPPMINWQEIWSFYSNKL